MHRVYYEPDSPASFGGVKRLVNAEKNKDVKKVKTWLSKQDTYTLHKPVRYRFPRRRTIVYGAKEQFQCDLIDVQKLRKDNDGNGYILTCIDVFTKMGYARPIKNKTSTSIIPAFKSIFKASGRPKRLQTDKGTEFLNGVTQQYFKNNGIHHFTSQNESIKAAVCERWNRTLLNRLFRAFTFKQNRRYIDILPKLVSSYNRSYHRSIKRRPVDVNSQNAEDVWQALYGKPYAYKTNRLKVGDRVRISKAKRLFKKGYLPSWSGELFTINRVLKTNPVTFNIKDDAGEELIGAFYQEELQKVGEKTVYEIERIIRERKTTKGRWEVFVKWKDYPASFNSWIFKSSIQKKK